MLRNIIILIVTSCLFLVLPGCITDIGEEEFLPGEVQKSCVYPNHPSVAAGSGAFSLTFDQGTYWIFNGTVLKEPNAQGDLILPNSGVTTFTAPACSGELQFVTDSLGQLLQIIPFTEEEREFNSSNPEGARIDIWPIGGFVFNNAGYVYFQKALVRGFLDITPLGTGIARIEFGGAAERLTPNVHPQYPTLLWLSPQANWGRGVFLDQDEFVYLYGCFQQSTLGISCGVARVSPGSAADLSAYEYYDALNGRWVSEPQNASVIFSGARAVSAGYNAFLGKYMLVYARNLTNDIEISLADHPRGPFTESRKLFTGDSPAQFWVRDVHLHPAYFQENGRTLFLSYYSDPGNGSAGMRFNYYKLQ
jgi:hypothetical protein